MVGKNNKYDDECFNECFYNECCCVECNDVWMEMSYRKYVMGEEFIMSEYEIEFLWG